MKRMKSNLERQYIRYCNALWNPGEQYILIRVIRIIRLIRDNSLK